VHGNLSEDAYKAQATQVEFWGLMRGFCPTQVEFGGHMRGCCPTQVEFWGHMRGCCPESCCQGLAHIPVSFAKNAQERSYFQQKNLFP